MTELALHPHDGLRGRHGAAILSVFSTMVYTVGLGALLTLVRTPWYPAYGEGAPLSGSSSPGPGVGVAGGPGPDVSLATDPPPHPRQDRP